MTIFHGIESVLVDCYTRGKMMKTFFQKANLCPREWSPASVGSVDLGSCLSDQTCSSILSSSSSSISSLASIGPTSQDSKQDMETSHPKLSTKIFHNEDQENAEEIKGSDQPRDTCGSSVSIPLRRQCQRSVADQFAKGMSEQVLETALEQCRRNRWLRVSWGHFLLW